ncbi:unnamed protein product [Owenia fusiformis]|uniref:Uncharacterized protein n=1 Tax=Owenia fusiformis TaxID=6347 RepID=A0A8J1UZE4_OWEFU|nr:unnamed protein product [Owenia fusiformis]
MYKFSIQHCFNKAGIPVERIDTISLVNFTTLPDRVLDFEVVYDPLEINKRRIDWADAIKDKVLTCLQDLNIDGVIVKPDSVDDIGTETEKADPCLLNPQFCNDVPFYVCFSNATNVVCKFKCLQTVTSCSEHETCRMNTAGEIAFGECVCNEPTNINLVFLNNWCVYRPTFFAVVLSIVCGLILVISVLCLCLICRRRCRKKSHMSQEQGTQMSENGDVIEPVYRIRPLDVRAAQRNTHNIYDNYISSNDPYDDANATFHQPDNGRLISTDSFPRGGIAKRLVTNSSYVRLSDTHLGFSLDQDFADRHKPFLIDRPIVYKNSTLPTHVIDRDVLA